MERDASFGSWLTARRQTLRLSRPELARRVACATVTLRKIEEDARRPSPELAALLADRLAVPARERVTFVRVARGELRVDYLPAADQLAISNGAGGTMQTLALPTRTPPILEATFGRATLVGRSAEWHVLRSLWHVASQGQAQVVIISGEAGIGKTRLSEELLDLVVRSGARTAWAQTYAATGPLAYAPLVAWLRSQALWERLPQLSDADLSELSRLMPEVLDDRPGLLPPGQVTESWQRLRLFEALARVVSADRLPLLLVLDDLQWCDEETLDWLAYLLQSVPLLPLLLLVTVRAEDQRIDHLRPWWFSIERAVPVTTLELGPLDEVATLSLATKLSTEALDPQQIAHLYQQTEGNPLFVVELLRALLAPGQTAHHIPDDTAVSGLTGRLRALLQTRLSQLSPAARELADIAAVIGRSFTSAFLVAASTADERTVFDALDELWQRRIVREQPDGGFDVSHDKLREVAYASLTPLRRPLLHRRVAEALVTVYADTINEVSADLAEHYRRAGMPEPAIHAYRWSAGHAHRIGAIHEAVKQLQQSAALIEQIPPTPARLQLQLELQAELAATLMQSRGFSAPEVEQAYERALELCRRAERTAELFPILWGLHEVFLFQARGRQARALAEQLLATAEQLQDPNLILQGNHAMWGVLFHLFPNDLQLAVMYAERGLVQYDAHRHHSHILHFGGHDTGICCRQVLMRTYWLLGYPNRARQYVDDALRLGEQQGHPFSHAMVLDNMAMLYHFMGDAAMADYFATQSLVVANEHQIALIIAESRILQAWARAQQGAAGDWIGQAREGITAWCAAGAVLQQTYHQQVLAEICLLMEESSAALVASEAAIAIGVASGEGLREAEAHRLHGAALLATGAPADQAEAAYQQALGVARRQGTRSLELRTSASLARLWQGQGRHVDAYQLLAPIFAWFTEGFDTADLVHAQALLHELSASAGIVEAA